MRALVLGGTSFVGRAVVDDLLARGHEVTLFSRGVTGPDLFPGVPRLVGDRSTGDLAALGEGDWDATVDVSAYVPRHVAQAVEALGGPSGGRGGRYLFISTGSVYDRTAAGEQITEQTARLASERGTEVVDGDTYGPLKVACEDDVLAAFGDGATIVRPGVVAGPHDVTDRFTSWVRRAAQGGRVALPGRPDQPVQVVDSRDLARLVVRLLEDDRPGTFNAVGPAEPVTLEEMVRVCALGAEVEVVPVAEQPGAPLVLPDPSWDVMFRRSREAAEAAGLPSTPLTTTAADVLAWDRERGTPSLLVGLSPDEEAALLAQAVRMPPT